LRPQVGSHVNKVSVIIPAYNHATYLYDAVNSVLNSTYKNLELIVVDDGSIDNTEEVARFFPEVQYLYQANRGAHAAINKGIEISSGEYIAILNDDDIYHPHHIEVGIKNLLDYGNDFFIGRCQVFGAGQKYHAMINHIQASEDTINSHGFVESILKINWATSTSSFIFSRALSAHLSGFEQFQICHDLDFILRALFQNNISFGVSVGPTWSYRCHETNSGSKISKQQQDMEIIYSMGRCLIQVNQDPSALIEKIGYGLSRAFKTYAFDKSPWNLEKYISRPESISAWLSQTDFFN